MLENRKFSKIKMQWQRKRWVKLLLQSAGFIGLTGTAGCVGKRRRGNLIKKTVSLFDLRWYVCEQVRECGDQGRSTRLGNGGFQTIL